MQIFSFIQNVWQVLQYPKTVILHRRDGKLHNMLQCSPLCVSSIYPFKTFHPELFETSNRTFPSSSHAHSHVSSHVTFPLLRHLLGLLLFLFPLFSVSLQVPSHVTFPIPILGPILHSQFPFSFSCFIPNSHPCSHIAFPIPVASSFSTFCITQAPPGVSPLWAEPNLAVTEAPNPFMSSLSSRRVLPPR